MIRSIVLATVALLIGCADGRRPRGDDAVDGGMCASDNDCPGTSCADGGCVPACTTVWTPECEIPSRCADGGAQREDWDVAWDCTLPDAGHLWVRVSSICGACGYLRYPYDYAVPPRPWNSEDSAPCGAILALADGGSWPYTFCREPP